MTITTGTTGDGTTGTFTPTDDAAARAAFFRSVQADVLTQAQRDGLRSAVEAAPGAFELVSLRGCGCRRYHIGGEFYSHIRRAV